jgi:hypothetical protein
VQWHKNYSKSTNSKQNQVFKHKKLDKINISEVVYIDSLNLINETYVTPDEKIDDDLYVEKVNVNKNTFVKRIRKKAQLSPISSFRENKKSNTKLTKSEILWYVGLITLCLGVLLVISGIFLLVQPTGLANYLNYFNFENGLFALFTGFLFLLFIIAFILFILLIQFLGGYLIGLILGLSLTIIGGVIILLGELIEGD